MPLYEKKSAEEIFNLLNNSVVLKDSGKIYFSFGGVNVTVRKKDIIGNIIQEWFECWLDYEHIYHRLNTNTQMPPDVFLSESEERDLLEVKSFDVTKSPNFDIADFMAFKSELLEKPYFINTKYLIFGYSMDQETGDVTVENLWLKNLWEILRPSKKWAINVQCKDDRIHKIRPGKWYAKRPDYLCFDSKESFISAFAEAIRCNDSERGGVWRQKFINAYEEYYDESIDVPYWPDIKMKFMKKKERKLKRKQQQDNVL